MVSHGPAVVFWFRRDLRVDDNHGLHQALQRGRPLLPIFIFDDELLRGLPRDDARVEFIHQALIKLHADLGDHLRVLRGRPVDLFRDLIKQHKISAVFCGEDYEPYARARDERVGDLLEVNGIEFYRVKDQVIFAPGEVLKDDGSPYKMFTPYARRWRERLKKNPPVLRAPKPRVYVGRAVPPPSLAQIGFKPSGLSFPKSAFDRRVIKDYARTRDDMGLARGTSRLGPHLRFGTVSVRKLLLKSDSPTFVNELIWREFFKQLLEHFPHTVSEPFDERFARVPWSTDEAQFAAWCEGRTGYPVVDAGMRELNQTGFMHNRARMIVASFLTKHLLVDWRRGERYFAGKLLDFELAANVGNWQWAAGCGCDASPYFRIFNPRLQAKRFDRDGAYVRRWIPELGTNEYPNPIVEHEMARARAIETLRRAVKGQT